VQYSFAHWQPPGLQPWVPIVWYSAGAMDKLRERLLPAPTIELVINLGAPMHVLEGRGTATLRGAVTGGLATSPQMLGHPPVHAAIGVRLHPLAARAVLARPLSDLSDCFATLEELCGRSEADALVDACHAAGTPEARMRVAVEWVARRIRCADAPDRTVGFVARELERTHGAASVTALRAQAGAGKNRLYGAFADAFGVSPKVYARLLRFARVLALFDRAAPPCSLASLALDAGYYDQSHMNGELRALTGLTPRQLVGTRNAGGFTISE
jgi:AraC-like DNA-binding protein